MENKPRLEPVRLADWAHNSAFFAKDIQLMSETKRSKQLETESNAKVRLNPIPPSQLNLSFQALKPKCIGQTSVQPVTSIKKNNWNSSVKIVSKEERMTDIKSNIRKTLNFNSQAKTTNTRKTLIEKATPQIHMFKTLKVKKEGSDLNNEIKFSGKKRIPVTPKSKEIEPKKLKINTPKSILRNFLIKNTPLSTASRKSCDGDATFLCIEKEVDDMGQEKEIENDLDINAPLPSSTPFKTSNVSEYFPISDADSLQKDKTILDFSNVSENENPVVALCDAFKKALISHTCQKTDLKLERGSLISVIEVALKHLQEIEESEKENTSNNNRKQLLGVSLKDFCRTKPPTFKIQKKIVFQISPKKCHVSPKVNKVDAINVYMGLKRNLNFLNTPKIDKTQNNETDTPIRMKKNLQSQINRLYNDSES
ncbi:uncharacterized protein LOC123706555 [Pieris brassicae]|uniref:Uncharacterized protein n=1 Tax=Pieris brassicae TaxID=7116 RepID=A0A9P0TX21_PIEBR|nr:uncharacterized protein LOC123706555 [Pieris brassicae]CAH4037175.1 unnamed protein product [Pieris brassicae]